MKVLIIGATGTIGQAVTEKLANHELILAGFDSGDVQVDLGDKASIQHMFETVGKIDAIVSTAGVANFGPLAMQSDDDYALALNNKLMGQVNLVRVGKDYVNQGGSITLTSGMLSRHPMAGSASVSMVNGALESFVKAAALELERLRVNVVAPAFVKETMAKMGMDSTHGISASDTAKTYVAAVEGDMTGKTLDVSR
ncbi:TPA: short chain dehydrogenase [Vibrio vulnificus]|uniref:short chain dehydrogenase n=1 Tax=Vibrio vulnificus TaxID=672 RepID=UPI001A2CC576|nr:short chain dehydrogenase [Vibrio vulnificus]EGQ8091455.1 short chain dehydrogenase [Vibrio vulnificus]EHH0746689.1 short chain dehydrogenase [Vibrio vulnificus]MCA0761941.1 short chain dehydrogenase [Vibrio vulnificus]HAS6252688.1 short chain dehydrogenase [Vibrio vulnificus]HAT7740555.1 short chain dehydrogenase [Vibrio vulnificus]